MAIYEFICDNCDLNLEVVRPISEGPPSEVRCIVCHGKMRQNFDCQFVLRGPGWAGKEAKHGGKYFEGRTEQDKHEKEEHGRVVAQGETDDIMKHRRRGRRASKEYRKHNQQAWERYKENKRKGVVDDNKKP